MSGLRDYLTGADQENPLIQQAHKTEAEIRGDLGQAVVDWYEGAKAGIKEVERAATNMGANASPEQIRERMLTGMADDDAIDDLNEEQSIHWYDKATKTFQQETVQPLAVGAAALGGLPGAVVMTPFLIESARENIEKAGISQGMVNTVKGLIPVYGTVTQEGFDEYAEEHPLRAALSVGFDAASVITPALDGARRARKNYLIKKSKKTPLEAEQIVRAEFDLPQAKKQSKQAKGKKNKAAQKTKRKLKDYVKETVDNNDEKDVTTSNFETKSLKGDEALDPVKNKKVSKDVDDIIRKGFDEVAENEKQVQEFIGALGEEIEPAPPTSYKGTVTLNQIRELADSITPVRLGRLRTSKGVLGYQFTQLGGVRLRSFKDLSILSHELGHYLDTQLGIKGADDELKRGVVTGRLKNSNYPPEKWRSEGIAEFTATYLLNPEKASQLYPEYFKSFKEELTKIPELGKRVDLLGEYIRTWYHQNAGARVRGTLEFQGENKMSLIEKGKKLAAAGYQAWVNDVNMLDNAIKAGGFDGLSFDDNPVNFALALKNTIPGRVNALWGKTRVSTNAVISALEKVFNIELNKVTMKDVYAPLEKLAKSNAYPDYLKKIGAKDWHEAFATYAYAKHALEVFGVQTLRTVEKLTNEITLIAEEIKKLDNNQPEKAKKLHELGDKLKEERRKIMSGEVDAYKLPNKFEDYYQMLEEAPTEFKKVSELLRHYNSNLLRIAVQYGLLKRETANLFLKDYPYYVPLKRDFSIEQGAFRNAKIKEAYVDIDKFYKALSEGGSERVVKDPLAGMMQITQKLISDGEHNIVGQKLAALADMEGGSTLMLKADLGKAVGGIAKKPVEHIVYVWKKGKRYTYQAIAPGLYEAITSMSKAEGTLFGKAAEAVLRPPASILRIGATASPFYTLWQFVKDSLFSGITTKTGMKPFVGTIKGLDKLWRNTDQYLLAKFEVEGIGFSTRIGAEDIQGELQRLAGGAPKWKNNKIVKGLNWALQKNTDFEAAPRLEEFARGLKQGMSTAEAAAAARDITLNFSRAGSIGRKLNRTSAFFNAQIQGTDKLIRAFRDNPRRTMLASMAYLTIPTLAYWSYVKDKDWYRDLPYEDKMRNWYVEGFSGTIYKFPKPDLIGYLFASTPEAMLNYLYANDREALSASNLGGFLASNTAPTNFLPTGMRPLFENWFNRNIFRGRPVVNQKEAKKEDKDQYNNYTSEIAKGIGSAVNYSPLKIDNVLKGTTGSLGQMLLDGIDKMVQDNKRPERDTYESIRFFYTPGGRSRTSDVFYAGLEKLEKRYNSSNQREKGAELKGMKKAQQEVTKIRRQINNILNNDNLTAAQKRERIDGYNKRINNIQRRANAHYLGYKYIQAP